MLKSGDKVKIVKRIDEWKSISKWKSINGLTDVWLLEMTENIGKTVIVDEYYLQTFTIKGCEYGFNYPIECTVLVGKTKNRIKQKLR